MELDQECLGRELIRHGLQGRSLPGSFDTAEQAFRFNLDLVEAPAATLDDLELVRISRAVHIQRSRLEKLRAHAQEANEVGGVLHVVLIFAHYRLSLLAHVAAEVRAMQATETIERVV